MRIEVTARRRTGVALAMLAAILFIGAGTFPGSLALAQDTDATGVIAGSVTADHGDVRALRVKAHDTVRRIAYTVYTQNGRYRVFNLPPSTYDVTVIEEAFESPTATVEVSAGATTTVDIALSALGAGPEAGRGGARGVRPAQLRRRGGRRPHGGDRRLRHALSAPPGPRRHAALLLRLPRPGRLPPSRAAQRARAGDRRSTGCSTSTAAWRTWPPACRR